MNKKILFIVSTLLISISSFSQKVNDIMYQTYYDTLIKAHTYYASEKYNEALKLYEQAFSNNKPFCNDVEVAMQCAEAAQNNLVYEKFNSLYNSLVSDSQKIPLVYYEEDMPAPGLSHGRENKPMLLNNVDDGIIDGKGLSNADIYLTSFCIMEQNIVEQRKLLRSQNVDRARISYLWVPSVHFMLNLWKAPIDISRVKSNIWENERFINAIVHMAQVAHQVDSVLFQRYDGFLREMVDRGNLHPLQYAKILEILKEDSSLSLYGESYNFNMETFEIEKIKELVNPENVDSLRANIHLAPLWVEAKIMNYRLPNNYKIIDHDFNSK